jgi:hypothetical protein
MLYGCIFKMLKRPLPSLSSIISISLLAPRRSQPDDFLLGGSLLFRARGGLHRGLPHRKGRASRALFGLRDSGDHGGAPHADEFPGGE